MEKVNNIKALYIIVNAGFADEIVEMARKAGATGATIINARGTGAVHKAIFGITIDAEKEMILSLVDEDTADRIITIVKEKAGVKSPANGICFIMPVDKMIAVNKFVPPAEKQE
ncbi:nitrogen regulatory protein P-II family [Sporobacter termitidis DSM 10068]|uniref:Nitrogen regulatory protein P-II family n=1 Tax=Sporobacter termitidis DSM 10068 TaxID=1123282 RepID=A0A1M5Y6Z0_9FIRM|nr:P-II family nitrogen regulator [Sporobacter termitidis]SHI07865.1 nitrogen regulatory protein P-II family [Sporobacter termitidis DSM 10068]